MQADGAQLQAERDDLADRIAALRQEFANARFEAQMSITESRGTWQTEVDEILDNADQAWLTSYRDARDGLNAARYDMSVSIEALKELSEHVKDMMKEQDAASIFRAYAALGSVLQERQRILQDMDRMDEKLDNEKQESIFKRQAAMELRLSRWEEFKAKYKQRLTQVLAQHLYAKAFKEWQNERNNDGRFGSRDAFKWVGIDIDAEKFANEVYGQQVLVAFAECLPGAGEVLDAFKAFTGLDAAGNKVTGGERVLSGLAIGLTVLGLGAVDGPADNVVAMQIKKLDEVTDGINDASRGLRRAAGAAGDVLDGAAGAKPGDGGCFKPGTLVHRMASDPQAVLALLAEELAIEEPDESLIWWILTGIAAATVALAVAKERRRHNANKSTDSHVLATAKIDELFSSNGLWEPQSWKEAEPESELAVAL